MKNSAQLLQEALKKRGVGRGSNLAKDLLALNVRILALTDHSFLGKYRGVKVYGYHNYQEDVWEVELA